MFLEIAPDELVRRPFPVSAGISIAAFRHLTAEDTVVHPALTWRPGALADAWAWCGICAAQGLIPIPSTAPPQAPVDKPGARQRPQP